MGYRQDKREEEAYEVAETILYKSAAKVFLYNHTSLFTAALKATLFPSKEKVIKEKIRPKTEEFLRKLNLNTELYQRIMDNQSAPLELPASELYLDLSTETLENWGIKRKNWGVFERRIVQIMDKDLISAMKRVVVELHKMQEIMQETRVESKNPDSEAPQQTDNIVPLFASRVKSDKTPDGTGGNTIS